MSEFVKRVLILKSTLKATSSTPLAVVRAEGYDGNISVSLSSTENNVDAFAVLFDGSSFFKISNGETLSSQMSIKKGLAAGYFIFTDNKAKIAAFGTSGAISCDKEEFEKLYEKNCQKEKTSFDNAKDSLFDYNDEKIAERNYYLLADENEKLSAFNADIEAQNKTKADEKTSRKEAFFDEADNEPYKKQNLNDGFYYEKIKDEVNALLKNGETEHALEQTIPQSRFVKILYSKDKYYFVGIVGLKPSYICYGVEGVYGEAPDKLKPHATFVPKNLFNLTGEGYYIMFQSAKSGSLTVPDSSIFGF